MIWSNIGILSPPSHYGIVIMLSVIAWYIGEKDYKERRIPNHAIIAIAILGAIWNLWNLLNLSLQKPFLGENLLELLVILGGGYILWRSRRVGAGDIKLTLILSCFFILDKNPFLFIENIICITIIYSLISILYRIFYINASFPLRRDFFHEVGKIWIGLVSLCKSGKIGKYRDTFVDCSFWIFSLLSLIMLEYSIYRFAYSDLYELRILREPMCIIMVFYILSLLIKKLSQKGKIQAIIILLPSISFFTWYLYQVGSGGSSIPVITRLFCFLLLIKIFFLCIETLYLFLFSYKKNSTLSLEREHTLPYGIWILLGFFFTLLTPFHLLSDIMKFVGQAFHVF